MRDEGFFVGESFVGASYFPSNPFHAISKISRNARASLGDSIIGEKGRVISTSQNLAKNKKYCQNHDVKINTKYDSRESILLRYGENINDISFEYLKKASLREGAQIVGLGNISEVEVSLLDLSSSSYTGTFKDWLAGITIADCISKGIKKYVCQSSGNTGNALAAYSAKNHLKSILFYPANSSYKINSHAIQKEFTTAVECRLSEPEIKLLAKKISEDFGIPLLPTFEHQILANKLRAYFLAEYCDTTKRNFDWHIQSLSSGYGPFGFYDGIKEISKNQNFTAPKFLGVQQEAVHPYATDYWAQNGLLPQLPENKNEVEVIEPTLFRTNPTEKLFDRMRNILATYGGAISLVTNVQYHSFENKALKILERAGVSLAVQDDSKMIIEKSGLLALIGTILAVQSGVIRRGEKALVAFTGGVRLQTGASFLPDYTLSDIHDENILDKIKRSIS